MNEQIPSQPHNSESLLNILIGLAIRRHTERCEKGMDSRLNCTCGADLHNAKVQGSAIALRKAMYEEMLPEKHTSPVTIPTTGTRMVPEEAPKAVKEPKAAPQPVQEQPKNTDKTMPPKFETGTSIPGIEGGIPLAKEQPFVPDNPNAGLPAAAAGEKPAPKGASARR